MAEGMVVSSLDALLRPVDSVELEAHAGPGEPQWLRAESWRLLARPSATPTGEVVERFILEDGASIAAVRDADGAVHVPFDFDEAYANFVAERWCRGVEQHALTPGQLQLYYRVKRLLPRSFWLQVRRTFVKLRKPPEFPRWPLEDAVERLVRFRAFCHLLAAGQSEAEFAWFWPGTHRAAVILTHDVESADGLRLALELADLEQERGLRSSFNVVAGDYTVDDGILRELEARGFEIGLHGLHHDRSLFSSRAEFERQLPALQLAAKHFGSVGFRSPATHRVLEWLDELPASYDASVPHSDPYEPQPGGSCTLWPYHLGDIVELPYTLPQDHTLFTLLRRRSVEPWLDQMAAIEARHGLVQCLSHPDRGYLGDPDKRAIYREFLDAVAARRGVWKALPSEVADWWRSRHTAATTPPGGQLGTMVQDVDGAYARLCPPATVADDADAPVEQLMPARSSS